MRLVHYAVGASAVFFLALAHYAEVGITSGESAHSNSPLITKYSYASGEFDQSNRTVDIPHSRVPYNVWHLHYGACATYTML